MTSREERSVTKETAWAENTYIHSVLVKECEIGRWLITTYSDEPDRYHLYRKSFTVIPEPEEHCGSYHSLDEAKSMAIELDESLALEAGDDK